MNKWDAVEKNDKTIYRYTDKIRNTLAYMPYAELIFISAKTGLRLQRLFETIDMVVENQTLRIQTGVLNEILTEHNLRPAHKHDLADATWCWRE